MNSNSCVLPSTTPSQTIEQLENFILTEQIFANYTLLMICHSIIIFLIIVAIIIFLGCVRDRKTSKFARNNVLIFCIIIFLCMIWNLVNYVRNYQIENDNFDVLNAIRGTNGTSIEKFNNLFDVLWLEGHNDWTFQGPNCGDPITNQLFSQIYFIYDFAFISKNSCFFIIYLVRISFYVIEKIISDYRRFIILKYLKLLIFLIQLLFEILIFLIYRI